MVSAYGPSNFIMLLIGSLHADLQIQWIMVVRYHPVKAAYDFQSCSGVIAPVQTLVFALILETQAWSGLRFSQALSGVAGGARKRSDLFWLRLLPLGQTFRTWLGELVYFPASYIAGVKSFG
jgi:hypothetical protein